MKMSQRGAANGSAPATSGGDQVDMAAVLRMVYESAHMRSPSCTHSAVNALAEYASGFFICCMHVPSSQIWPDYLRCVAVGYT